MDQRRWERPRKADALDLRYNAEDLDTFEDNWVLIGNLLN
jgi:hypothetical protein